jgi:hypothetical protein
MEALGSTTNNTVPRGDLVDDRVHLGLLFRQHLVVEPLSDPVQGHGMVLALAPRITSSPAWPLIRMLSQS